MTAQEHWCRLYHAVNGGPLAMVEALCGAAIPVLIAFGQAPGMEFLSRFANLLCEVTRAIESARFLVRLGCPKSGKGGIVLNPYEVPYADPR